MTERAAKWRVDRWVGTWMLVGSALSGCADGPASEDGGAGDGGVEQDATVIDDAGTSACIERNSAAEVAARDGFIEVCVDSVAMPRAVCGDGTPYRMSYHPADGPSAGLLVYFRGGGGCTDYVSCWGLDGAGGAGRRVSTLENDRAAPEIIPALGRTVGVFDRVDPTALFADFDIVYAPYCTGDGGLGSEERALERPPEAEPDAPATITTYFHGIDNRAAVIALAASTFPSPARVVAFGSSAGSYAAMGAMPELAAAHPTRPISYYGEGGVGVGRPSYNTLVEETLSALDGRDGRPLVRFVQFSFASDATQQDYAPPPYATDEAAFRGEVRSLLEARAARHPENFRYFALPGTCHTLALQVALYQAFAETGGRWAPVVPAVRPNPYLVRGDRSLVDFVREVTRGDGPFDDALTSVDGDWTTPSIDCPLPGR